MGDATSEPLQVCDDRRFILIRVQPSNRIANGWCHRLVAPKSSEPDNVTDHAGGTGDRPSESARKPASRASDCSRKPLRGVVFSNGVVTCSILTSGGSAPQHGIPEFGQNLCEDAKTGFDGSYRQLDRWRRDSAKPPAVRVRFSSERIRSDWNHCFALLKSKGRLKFTSRRFGVSVRSDPK